jgi:hypothetical protein
MPYDPSVLHKPRPALTLESLKAEIKALRERVAKLEDALFRLQRKK